MALLAFGVLSIAAVLAILLAFQERALRHRQFGHWLRALPPLTLTETLLFRLISAGFVLLTLTLRSDERRVGKECVSTCGCRGAASHYKKNRVSTLYS